MIEKKDYMERDKFFFASLKLFPKWPYRSRLAIGMSLKDFWAKDKLLYNFIIKKDKSCMYQIASYKARVLGQIYKMPYGSLPNIIPLQEFKKIPIKKEENKTTPAQVSLFKL
jgi:hypothetical protein